MAASGNDILRQLVEGNEKPYFHLYRQLRSDFLDWACFSYNVARDEAEDIYQEVFLIFWKNVLEGKLTELSCDIKTYLFSIGKHLLLNSLKKNKRTVTFHADELMNGMHSPFDSLHEDEHRQLQLSSLLDRLTAKERRVVELYYLEEMDMKSIARQLGYKSSDVAKKKKYECIKKLMTMVRADLFN